MEVFEIRGLVAVRIQLALLLDQLNVNVADGEGVGRIVFIGEVREGAADDERRDEHDRDGSHKNGFLLHM